MSVRTVLLVTACALVPLLVPEPWLRSGLCPDPAVLAVGYLALRAGPGPAAVLGVALGLVGCPWTAEPLGQAAWLLGVFGWAAGHAGKNFDRERLTICAAVAFAGVWIVRGGAVAAVWLGTPDVPHAAAAAQWVAVAMCAVTTSVCAPAAFSLLGRSHLLADVERRARLRV